MWACFPQVRISLITLGFPQVRIYLFVLASLKLEIEIGVQGIQC